jgi:hypothetical protein
MKGLNFVVEYILPFLQLNLWKNTVYAIRIIGIIEAPDLHHFQSHDDSVWHSAGIPVRSLPWRRPPFHPAYVTRAGYRGFVPRSTFLDPRIRQWYFVRYED